MTRLCSWAAKPDEKPFKKAGKYIAKEHTEVSEKKKEKTAFPFENVYKTFFVSSVAPGEIFYGVSGLGFIT